jgi:hypothetical protein
VTNRNRQPDDDSRARVPETDTRGEAPVYTSARSRRNPRSPMRRVVPFLIMGGILLMIARHEVPAVDEWWERTFFAEAWKVKDTCRKAVLEAASQRQYVRVLKAGKVHHTKDGPYVDGLKIVVLGNAGGEEVLQYTCYLDNDGQLFRLVGKSQEP